MWTSKAAVIFVIIIIIIVIIRAVNINALIAIRLITFLIANIFFNRDQTSPESPHFYRPYAAPLLVVGLALSSFCPFYVSVGSAKE